MSENVNVISQEQIDATVKRIEELGRAKADLEMKNNEVDVHESDLVAIEKTCGVDSNDYNTKKLILDVSLEAKAELEKKVAELSFKKSELKPVLDAVIDQFEKSLRGEQETVYSIEFGECEKDKEGNAVTPCSNARKNFKQVMDNLKVEKGLVILAENDANTVLSARNLASIDTTLTSQINVYDIMKAGTIVLTKDSAAKIEEVYA